MLIAALQSGTVAAAVPALVLATAKMALIVQIGMLRRPFRFLLRDSHWGFVFKIQIFHVPVSFVSTHNLWSYFPEDVPPNLLSVQSSTKEVPYFQGAQV